MSTSTPTSTSPICETSPIGFLVDDHTVCAESVVPKQTCRVVHRTVQRCWFLVLFTRYGSLSQPHSFTMQKSSKRSKKEVTVVMQMNHRDELLHRQIKSR